MSSFGRLIGVLVLELSLKHHDPSTYRKSTNLLKSYSAGGFVAANETVNIGIL